MNERLDKTTAAAEPMHPADLADRLERLPIEEACRRLKQLRAEQAARVLAEAAPEVAADLMESIEPERLAAWLATLPAAQATDLIPLLEPLKRRQVLEAMPAEQAQHVRELLQYPPDTAGGIMSENLIALRADRTVAEALEEIRYRARAAQTDIAYIYVTDAARRLVGVLPVRELCSLSRANGSRRS